jgi:hypothetical protein
MVALEGEAPDGSYALGRVFVSGTENRDEGR